MSVKDTVTTEINNLGEPVRVINSTQTTDDETAYASVVTDTFVDGTEEGTLETAQIQPVGRSRDQEAEGRLLAGDMQGFFKEDSVITNNSLVKVVATNNLYKVKKIDHLRVKGELIHYEVILEFLRVVS